MAGGSRINKESYQNERILKDMIKEATTFDNRLKKVGLSINIKDLINDKDDSKVRDVDQISDSDEDLEAKINRENPDICDDSDDDSIDYRNLGKIDYDET